ncbi:MAG: protease inhibitor I42 family protein [Rhizobiales bacterium]|nr:protease inhibitor I42 family protein [Rhizobacter sp.]
MTNRSRAWGSLALCLPLALLGACAANDKPKPVAVQSVIQAPGQSAVTVSERDIGAAVVVEMAQELRVALPDSSWAISNNLAWSVESPNNGVLNVVGSRFERGPRDSNPAEAGGTTVWRLKPQAPGKVSLTFALRWPRSLRPPVQTAIFEVTVK